MAAEGFLQECTAKEERQKVRSIIISIFFRRRTLEGLSLVEVAEARRNHQTHREARAAVRRNRSRQAEAAVAHQNRKLPHPVEEEEDYHTRSPHQSHLTHLVRAEEAPKKRNIDQEESRY